MVLKEYGYQLTVLTNRNSVHLRHLQTCCLERDDVIPQILSGVQDVIINASVHSSRRKGSSRIATATFQFLREQTLWTRVCTDCLERLIADLSKSCSGFWEGHCKMASTKAAL